IINYQLSIINYQLSINEAGLSCSISAKILLVLVIRSIGNTNQSYSFANNLLFFIDKAVSLTVSRWSGRIS
ncbi:hypothetical protein, partial [Dapis sp. BLCC M172]|uniref:hypothetical protein n=1 Tax=Dapis sp. BLCC M172 TaxID=2975281 RepID=UPI003CFA6E54